MTLPIDSNDVIAWELNEADPGSPPWVNSGTGGTLDLVVQSGAILGPSSAPLSPGAPGDPNVNSLGTGGNFGIGGGFNYVSTAATLSPGSGTTIGESTDITVSMRILLEGYPGSGVYSIISAKNGDPSIPYLCWFLALNNTNNGSWYWDVDTGLGDQPVGYLSGVNIPLAAWTHIGGTYNSTTKQLTAWMNGIPITTATANGSQVIQYHNHGQYDLGGGVNQASFNTSARYTHYRIADIARPQDWFRAMSITGLSCTPTTDSLAVGATVQLVVTGTYLDARTDDCTALVGSQGTYTSSNTSVATVSSSGLITAGITTGSATITATLGSDSNGPIICTCVVSVLGLIKVVVTSPSVPSAILTAGTTAQLTATAYYADGHTTDVSSSATWLSSDTDVATVSSSGLVTAGAITASAAFTTITATFDTLPSTLLITVLPVLSDEGQALFDWAFNAIPRWVTGR